ncbi:DUF3693 domain-containing protein [Stenotrophomonas indicatrix]|uniref:DUF3693 domain-containing protein n=1 Tax=Stenotrophomonas indicatrix TaxID=2045451 RepID=UPI003CCEE7F6
MEEQAEGPAQRKVWRSVLDRLSAAAAVLVLAVVAVPGAARAKSIDLQGFSAGGQPHSVYYVQSRLSIDSATKPDQWNPGHHPGSSSSHSPLHPWSPAPQGQPGTSWQHTPTQAVARSSLH